MATVALRVEVPTYGKSFNVSVPASATILDVKREIESTCAGRPTVSGQRLIWRGRYLSDSEQVEDIHKASDGHCVMHLSVHPSAWAAGPPTSAKPSSTPTSSSDTLLRTNHSLPPSNFYIPNANPFPTAPPRSQSASYISSKHRHALAVLMGQVETRPDQTEEAHATAKRTVESHGYIWPSILDEEYPAVSPKSAEGLIYDTVTVESRSYLRLRNPNAQPTLRQIHALKVLTYTFFLCTLPPPPTASFTVPPALESVPAPHVNELLAQMGFPPLRVGGPNVNGAALHGHLPDADGQGIMADIPVRALLAPLFMVLLRTVLLLYFFSPTSKPIFGVLIAAWIFYEVYTHVRIVVLRPLEDAANQRQQRAAGNEQANQGRGGPGLGMDNGAQPQPGNGQVTPGVNVRNDTQRPESQRSPPPPIPESTGILDTLAFTRIASENTLLFAPPGHPPQPPTWTEKATTFASLFVTSLHPGVWNRRRRVLREREGRIRMEMNTIEREEQQEEGGEADWRAQARNSILAAHSRRPAWVKDYVVRARAGEWVEE
ncbi:hypothetical protein CONPUDRAFT_81913 [Coniophora puteana RWD-64-598 SS2]|uniref:Ubiquitin-like domain-containing protein n=1 Tax=Coniophora puteana (strain RWD-64-598) TaxID=741705 RepID=A0A5M3MTR6_CONPW|nr:uncharacterized protein CONPUDRAFT_81913 [Coniophora puteana RWD-64-598 SS2]EIW82437.1 hypothetical protein CONPUDRAFT_81913 [Coniophora puteana RWD-64-598 SS2]